MCRADSSNYEYAVPELSSAPLLTKRRLGERPPAPDRDRHASLRSQRTAAVSAHTRTHTTARNLRDTHIIYIKSCKCLNNPQHGISTETQIVYSTLPL